MNDFNIGKVKALDHLKDEFSKVRAGRPGSELLDGVMVEAYGSPTPLNQVASISTVDSNMIVISPWDKSLIQDIQKAIQASNLGVNPVVDSESLKLIFPPLNEEKRKEYVKLCGAKAEEAKVSLRQLRKEIMQELDKKKKDGLLTEDQLKVEEKKLQLDVDTGNKEVDSILSEKEKKLMTI